MAEWLARSTQQWVVEVPLRLWGPWFEGGIQHMKQFADDWYLFCCQGPSARKVLDMLSVLHIVELLRAQKGPDTANWGRSK